MSAGGKPQGENCLLVAEGTALSTGGHSLRVSELLPSGTRDGGCGQSSECLSPLLPFCGLLLSKTEHLCSLLNSGFKHVAGVKQVMTGCYSWFQNSDQETPSEED